MNSSKIIYITEHERKKKRKTHTNISLPKDGKCVFKNCNYVCNSKKIQTYSMHILNYHSHEFKDESIYKYKCSTCSDIFDKRAYLISHIKRKHEEQTFSCYACNNYFKTKTSLINHYMRTHTQFTSDKLCVDNDNKCLNCHKTLNKSGFMYHMSTCIGINKIILAKSTYKPSKKNNNITCQGCIENQSNQLAHVNIGGCLYVSDNEL